MRSSPADHGTHFLRCPALDPNRRKHPARLTPETRSGCRRRVRCVTVRSLEQSAALPTGAGLLKRKLIHHLDPKGHKNNRNPHNIHGLHDSGPLPVPATGTVTPSREVAGFRSSRVDDQADLSWPTVACTRSPPSTGSAVKKPSFAITRLRREYMRSRIGTFVSR